MSIQVKEYVVLISYDGSYGKAYRFDTELERKGYISGYQDGADDFAGRPSVYTLENAPFKIKQEYEKQMEEHAKRYA